MGNKAKGLILGGAIFGAICLWARRSDAAMDVQLTEHFRLSEFLRSTTVPELARYTPTAEEMEALLRHASYLEQIRLSYGPTQITDGLRPKAFNASYYIDSNGKRIEASNGINVSDALRAVGYNAALTSDHIPGHGSDIRFARVHTTNRYVEAYNAVQKLADTRQVILYLTRGTDGNLYADHLHVSNVAPGYPKEVEPNYAWINIDGKRIDSNAGALNV